MALTAAVATGYAPLVRDRYYAMNQSFAVGIELNELAYNNIAR
jgi:hypothetical protein